MGLGTLSIANKRIHEAGRTASAGTAIQVVIPPVAGRYTILEKLVYEPGATTHTLTGLRPFASTTLSAGAAAAQAVINLTADPGDYTGSSVADNNIAANDLLVIEMPDGLFHLGVVSSVATLAITLTVNVPTGGFDNGATVWFFGHKSTFTDPDPNTGLAAPSWTLPTGSVKTIECTEAGFFGSLAVYQPLILNVDNITNAGTLRELYGVYAR